MEDGSNSNSSCASCASTSSLEQCTSGCHGVTTSKDDGDNKSSNSENIDMDADAAAEEEDDDDYLHLNDSAEENGNGTVDEIQDVFLDKSLNLGIGTRRYNSWPSNLNKSDNCCLCCFDIPDDLISITCFGLFLLPFDYKVHL